MDNAIESNANYLLATEGYSRDEKAAFTRMNIGKENLLRFIASLERKVKRLKTEVEFLQDNNGPYRGEG